MTHDPGDELYAADPILAGRSAAASPPPNGTDSAPAPEDGQAPRQAVRPWFRRWPFLLFLGFVPVTLGFTFAALIAVVLLMGDQSRERAVRAGGSAVLVWWFVVVAAAWNAATPLPYVRFVLLAVAFVLLGRWARTRVGLERTLGSVLVGIIGVVAVLQLVPFGVRQPKVTKDEALERVVSYRADAGSEQVDGDQAIVREEREPFTQKPVVRVYLFEPNPDRATQDNDEPCFRRVQVYLVDGIGTRVAADKPITAEPDDDEDEDQACLPFREGQSEKLVDLQG